MKSDYGKKATITCGVCLKNCANRDIVCVGCVRFGNFKPIEKR